MRALPLVVAALCVSILAGCTSKPQNVDGEAGPAGAPARTAGAAVTLSPSAPTTSAASSQPPPARLPASGKVTLPRSVLLQPQDLGPGYKADDSEYQGDADLMSTAMYCETYKPKPYTGPKPRREGHIARSLSTSPRLITQHVSLSNTETQRWIMTDARNFVRDCKAFSFEGKQYRLEIIAEGFAGEESFLVRGTENYRYALMRQAEVGTQLEFTVEFTDQQIMELARKAMTRVCTAIAVC